MRKEILNSIFNIFSSKNELVKKSCLISTNLFFIKVVINFVLDFFGTDKIFVEQTE